MLAFVRQPLGRATFIAACAACDSTPGPTAAPPSGSARSNAPPNHDPAPTRSTLAPSAQPPVLAEPPFAAFDLTLPHALPARVVVPRGARGLPLVVALHGSHDRAEWLCDAYARVFSGRAVLLCPRGVPRDDWPGHERFTFPSVETTESEVRAAIEALAARLPAAFERTSTVILGFSIGAAMALFLFNRAPERFSGLVLIEGADDALDAAWTRWLSARRGRRSPELRLLIACGRQQCADRVKRKLPTLQAHVDGRLADGTGAGHTYVGLVGAAVARDVEWLLAPPR